MYSVNLVCRLFSCPTIIVTTVEITRSSTTDISDLVTSTRVGRTGARARRDTIRCSSIF